MTDHLELTCADGRLACRCRVATSFVSRFRGLMGAAQLPSGSGLLLPGTSSVHTHFMRFPIDVVFLDSAYRIVSVVELAAGECERLELREGDVLRAVAA
jgi:uncharacterized membrane protein (UPF0127 family)